MHRSPSTALLTVVRRARLDRHGAEVAQERTPAASAGERRPGTLSLMTAAQLIGTDTCEKIY